MKTWSRPMAYLVLVMSIAGTSAGCGGTWSAGRTVAADVLRCPEAQFDVLVPHSYNLAPGDHVYRGCGRTVVIRCATTPATTLCRPVAIDTVRL